MLTRDQILGADDRTRETVSVTEWGGDVIVSVMIGTERDEFDIEVSGIAKQDRALFLRNARARLLVRCLVDAQGKRLFTTEDVEGLGLRNSAVLERLALIAQRLNYMTDEAMEDLKGKSKPGRGDGQ
jgi:hypothetical protein